MVLGSQQDILVGGGVSVLVTSPDTESSVDMILGSQHVMVGEGVDVLMASLHTESRNDLILGSRVCHTIQK